MDAPLPDLERWGVRYLRRRSERLSAAATVDPIYILDANELRALHRIEHGVVARAAIAGALSAGASATAEVWARVHYAAATAPVTAWVLGVTVVATTFEIAFLYWDGLRSVHDLAVAAGVRLFPDGVRESMATAQALARAALELPNRPDPQVGVDPYREASKAALVLAALLYKVKIGLTNFVTKVLVRRLSGRALMRAWLPYVAVPVTAAWNAWVARSVIREARLRAIGPSAARERVHALLDGRPPLSPAAALAAQRSVGASMVGKRDLHPNLVALLALLRHRLGGAPEPLDERAAFLAQLPTLPPDDAHVRRLRRAFVNGRPMALPSAP